MSIMRWTPHTMARVAAAGVIMIAMSLVSGAESSGAQSSAGGSSAGAQAMDVALTYTCPFPSRAQQITVKIAGTLPTASTVGHPIQPRHVTMTPTLPRAALADLTALDATSVAVSTRMSVTVAQKGTSTKTTWSSLAASIPIPDSGDLPLPGSAMVPPATAETLGSAVFIAGALTLVLTPHKADGSATSPAGIPLDCRLELGPNAVLAHVPVTGRTSSVTPPPGTGTARTTHRTAQQQPDDTDPCLFIFTLPPVPGEAYMAGYANVNKLHGATLLGVENGQTTGHILLELGYEIIIDLCSTDGSTYVLSRGLLDYHGKHALPPAKATFLTFGFMPTTATLELTEAVGTDIEIESHSSFDGTNFNEKSTVTSHLSIRIHDVLVNGKPLDVGPHCESTAPMTVTLTGTSPDYTVNTGGPLTGTATMPSFAGCGVGEDLDSLFTASISGPGNFMKLTQGMPCTRPPDGPPINCDPIDRPKPQS